MHIAYIRNDRCGGGKSVTTFWLKCHKKWKIIRNDFMINIIVEFVSNRCKFSTPRNMASSIATPSKRNKFRPLLLTNSVTFNINDIKIYNSSFFWMALETFDILDYISSTQQTIEPPPFIAVTNNANHNTNTNNFDFPSTP